MGKDKPVAVEKKQLNAGFATRWNEARYSLILGLRPTWANEWNKARMRLLGAKKRKEE